MSAEVLKRSLGKLGDELPLPAETRERLGLHFGTVSVGAGSSCGGLLNDRRFQEYYERELKTIEGKRHAAAGQTEEVVGDKQAAPVAVRPTTSVDVSVWCLPATSCVFSGRSGELDGLDAALQDPNTHVVTVVGLAGCGKSALIQHWLKRLAPRFGDVNKVFGWSFGDSEAMSPALLLEHALTFFGDPEPEIGSLGIRAERLVKLIRQARALLVLDSLESVQDPTTHVINVNVVKILVRELARQMTGLLLLTSRFECPDVAHLEEHATTLRLPPLSIDDGKDLLARLKIKFEQDQVQAFVERCGGHALCMRILAGVAAFMEGGVADALEVSLVDADRHHAGDLSRIALAYDSCLAPLDQALLRAISTFSSGRLPSDALLFLMQEPLVAKACAAPAECGEVPIGSRLSTLEGLGLVNRIEDASGFRSVDVHPLVRGYYALPPLPDECRVAGHRCLRDFYRRLADGATNDVAGMEYSYAAVSNGISAKLYDEAIEDFSERLNRGRNGRSWDAYGRFDENIEVLRPLFEGAWDEPLPAISDEYRAFLLYEVGFYLSSQGRLAECVAPLHASIAANDLLENHLWVTFALLDLASVYLETGNFDEVMVVVEQSFESAEQLGHPFWCQACRCVQGYVALQSGDDALADRCFRETTSNASHGLNEDPFNVGIGAYLICDYWLGREVEYPGLFPKPLRSRRENSLAWKEIAFWFGRLQQAAGQGNSLLAQGLRLLANARLQALRMWGARPPQKLGLEPISVPQVLAGLADAVETLERSRLHHFLVPGYLTAAALERSVAQSGGCSRDRLDGASQQELLNRSLAHAETAPARAKAFGAHLYEADAHLELARISTVREEVSQVDEHVREARRMIEAFNYHRRRRELAPLERQASLNCLERGRNC